MVDRATQIESRRPRVGPLSDLAYAFVMFVFRQGLLGYWQPLMENPERIPNSGPLLVAANHPTILDPCLLPASFPRRLDLIMNKKVEALPLAGSLVREAGAIPVGPGCIEECLDRLQRGMAVGLFPEGETTFGDSLREFRSGIYVMAKLSGAPVLPIAIMGNEQLLPSRAAYLKGGPVRIGIGQPLHCHPEEPAEIFLGRLRQAVISEMERVSNPPDWRPNWKFKLLKALWVPTSWVFFKVVDWLKPDNFR